MLPQNYSFPHCIVSHVMRGARIHTIHADEEDDDEPQEESWFKKKEKRSKKSTKGKGVSITTGSFKAVKTPEEMMPAAYPGDPTEQEVIDNVRDIPDTLRPWGKVISFSMLSHDT